MSTRIGYLALGVAAFVGLSSAAWGGPQEGIWRAWLDSPGGQLPFHMELKREGTDWHATIINGPERIVVPVVTFSESEGELVLEFPYYNSRVEARLQEGGDRLEGRWQKGTGDRITAQMSFHARAGDEERFYPDSLDSYTAAKGFEGRWSVDFSQSNEPAVGLFQAVPPDKGNPPAAPGAITGTFLTATGDYRFLEGRADGRKIRLSAFDGSHAFLFMAEAVSDGSLRGEFWSGDKWHETWSARRDDNAQLPDGFTLTQAKDRVQFSLLEFPDLEGKKRSLADKEFAGKARIIEVFGSWCPNCHDASEVMNELHEKYAGKGLSIVGLAFEATGDVEKDAKQAKAFVQRHKLKYPVLLGGFADKEQVAKALPMIDRFRAYPTFIISDAEGKVEAIYTGFSGPATGEEHRKLKADFEKVVKKILERAS